MPTPVFIVGSGRCGSTMLTNMIRRHPKICSISEFFSMLSDGGYNMAKPFLAEPIDGARFWEILAEPQGKVFLGLGIPFPECLYPYETPGVRFTAQTGIPALMIAMLPHLTDDYEALYDTLAREIASWETAPIGHHYRRLFDWLRVRFGRDIWIERSGMGMEVVGHMDRMFPGAKFIHLVRDGRDVALSVNDHPPLRMVVATGLLVEQLGYDPFISSRRDGVDKLPAGLRALLPESFDRDTVLAYRNPLPACGRFWAGQILAGMEALKRIPPERLITLRYENFHKDGARELAKLTDFVGAEFSDPEWAADCAAGVKPPQRTWRDLPAGDIAALQEACRPGFDALAAAGCHFD